MDYNGEFLMEEDMFNDTIKIEGFVEIRNGDMVIKAKNKFVQTILQHIINFISMGIIPGSNAASQGPISVYNMYVGTDIAQATLYNTAALTTPIGGAPGTAPNSIGGVTSNPSNGVFQMSITATWNAGTLPGDPTIGEMALYLDMYSAPASLFAYQWVMQPYAPGGAKLASRLAAADGVFAPFAINSANPLSIVWTIQVSFV